MYKVISKKDYWAAMDCCPKLNQALGLKHIQDTVVLHQMLDAAGKCICEAGGGNSRVLEWLRGRNECWNVDAMEGVGNGPKQLVASADIRHVKGYFGKYDSSLPVNYFDFVFSVSVVEHVEKEELYDFMADCVRVLKPGGLMLHAIDVYLPDYNDEKGTPLFMDRVQLYRDTITSLGDSIAWIEPPEVQAPLYSSARYASNPDQTLYQWNKSFPQLVDVRARCQSCSLLLGVRKTK